MAAIQIYQDIQDENSMVQKFNLTKIHNKNPSRAVLQPLHNPNGLHHLKKPVKQNEEKPIVFVIIILFILMY